MHHFNLFTKKA